MPPVTANPWADAAIMGLSFLGGMFGNDQPQGTIMRPFGGNISAPEMMTAGTNQTAQFLDSLAAMANQPVHLRGAYAQPLPGFSGGGLPMSIGAPAMDPGFLNQGLYDLPGIKLGRGSQGPGFSNWTPPNDWHTGFGSGYGNQPIPNRSGNFFGTPGSTDLDPFTEAESALNLLGVGSGKSMVR